MRTWSLSPRSLTSLGVQLDISPVVAVRRRLGRYHLRDVRANYPQPVLRKSLLLVTTPPALTRRKETSGATVP